MAAVAVELLKHWRFFERAAHRSRKPRGKGVESGWIKQEIRHHEEWHEDHQSVDPMPYRWRYFS